MSPSPKQAPFHTGLHQPDRYPITARIAWDEYCDEPLWLYSEQAETAGMDPWTEIVGMDATRDFSKFILEIGRTGERHVGPGFIIYAQRARKVQP